MLGRPLALLALAGSLSGCILLGPDYERPPLPKMEEFRSETQAETKARDESLADLPWWSVFDDPVLNDLTKDAMQNNYDVRIALARVEQARALAGVAASEFYPQIGYTVGADRGKRTFLGNPSTSVTDTGNSFIGAGLLSWEIDLWGRIRRANEAALAQLLATDEARRGVMLTLLSDVGEAYYTLLQLDLLLEIARNTAASYRQSYDLFDRRFRGGVASRLETARAEANLASVLATIPDIERQIVITENRINVLLGRNPGPVVRGAALREQKMPPHVPVGLPSVLVERRPDLRQAEQTLVAANAQIGVAKAAYFPQITLTGSFGGVSTQLSEILKGNAILWSVGGALAGPIFTGGLLDAQYDVAVAQSEQARLQYEQAVLNAFQEVSNLLVTRQKLDESRAHQQRAVNALVDSVRYATERYVGGLASYFEVLEAQQQLYPAQNQLAQIDGGRFVVIVQLYKALGGGWRREQ